MAWNFFSFTVYLHITFSNRVFQFHDPRMSSILCVTFEQSKNICLLFIHSSGHSKIWVELCSRHYSWETLFIPMLCIENIIHSNTITNNIGSICNIQIFVSGTFLIRTTFNFILFSKFLPVKVR